MVGETDLFSGTEEDEALELGMRFEETKQHVQFLVTLNDHVVVQQGRWCYLFQLFVVVVTLATRTGLHLVEIVDLNVLVIPLKLQFCEFLD